jgi:hypothetical protein
MLNRSQVLSRPGWNPTNLRDLLGVPDQREPRQGSCPGSSLYNLGRVLDVEGSQQFKDAVAAAKHRARATKKSAVSKRKQLLAVSAAWPITVASIPIDDLYRRVLQGDDLSMFDPHALKSWAAHYVLTHLTNVDELYARLHSKVGWHEATVALERRTLREIARVYPELAVACRRGPSPRLRLLSSEDLQQAYRRDV